MRDQEFTGSAARLKEVLKVLWKGARAGAYHCEL